MLSRPLDGDTEESRDEPRLPYRVLTSSPVCLLLQVFTPYFKSSHRRPILIVLVLAFDGRAPLVVDPLSDLQLALFHDRLDPRRNVAPLLGLLLASFQLRRIDLGFIESVLVNNVGSRFLFRHADSINATAHDLPIDNLLYVDQSFADAQTLTLKLQQRAHALKWRQHNVLNEHLSRRPHLMNPRFKLR